MRWSRGLSGNTKWVAVEHERERERERDRENLFKINIRIEIKTVHIRGCFFRVIFTISRNYCMNGLGSLATRFKSCYLELVQWDTSLVGSPVSEEFSASIIGCNIESWAMWIATDCSGNSGHVWVPGSPLTSFPTDKEVLVLFCCVYWVLISIFDFQSKSL